MNAKTKKTPLYTPKEVKAVTVALSRHFKHTPQRRVRSLKTRLEIAQVAIEAVRKLDAKKKSTESSPVKKAAFTPTGRDKAVMSGIFSELSGNISDVLDEYRVKGTRKDVVDEIMLQVMRLIPEMISELSVSKKSTEVPSGEGAARPVYKANDDLSEEEIVKMMSLKPGPIVRMIGPDEEIDALGKMYALLKKFDVNTRHRMSVWIKDRFEEDDKLL